MSNSTVSQSTTEAEPALPAVSRRIIRHVKMKKRFFCRDTIEHIEPGQTLQVYDHFTADQPTLEVLTPGGARACFARSEVQLPLTPSQSGAFAFDALVHTLRPILDLAGPMDDAARRRIGYRVAELNVGAMTIRDLLEILTECDRIEVRKMMR